MSAEDNLIVDAAARKLQLAVINHQIPLHADAAVDLLGKDARSRVGRLEFSGDGIEGDDIGPVVMGNSRCGVNGFVLDGNLGHTLKGDELHIEGKYVARKK